MLIIMGIAPILERIVKSWKGKVKRRDGPDLYPRKDAVNPLQKSLGNWHLAFICALLEIVDSKAF